jgi:carbon monoxide dehydrogenase subunit G
MEITGQQIIAAPVDVVWNALNNSEILKNCLPGCEKVDQISPEEFHMVVKAAVGPLKASFKGVLRMTEADPPNACVMNFEGQGGPVGFAKGSSSVTLTAVAEGTQLTYTAKAQIGGKLAQVGSRLIDSVAKKMADDFFKAFRQQLAPESEPAPIPGAPTSNALALAQGQGVAASSSTLLPSAGVSLPVDSKQDSEPDSKVDAVLADRTGDTPTVPTWWLAPAAVLGALIAILGARYIQ